MNTTKQNEQKVMGKFNRNKKISTVAFYTLTASAIIAFYEFPVFATNGWSLILFLFLAGLCWFIPVAICAAEMATVKQWKTGGIYVWVSNILGQRWGFMAVFFQWFHITIGFVTMLYFIRTSLFYGIGGETGYNLLNKNQLDGTASSSYSQWIVWASASGIFLLTLI